ncbi:MAG TPA: hypothetical protein VFM14_01275 [Gemmatimonadales bacterium]|nr:hypothetical protein [Gemmatimonadales bacterium]
MRLGWILGVMAVAVVVPAAAQTSAKSPTILGTWKFDLKQGAKSGPRTVIVRPDSSASYGDETVRWRLKPDSLLLALGGEWVSYRLKFAKGGKKLTLSGGDLTDPIDFNLVGPPTARPDTLGVPPDPDLDPS